MDLIRGPFIVFLLFVHVFCSGHSTSAEGIKKIEEFRKNYQVAKFNESNSSLSHAFAFSPSIIPNYNIAYRGWRTRQLGQYHGATAKISLWLIPNVKMDSVSQYSISVGDGLRFVTTGFHVYPAFYKNNDLHFFTHCTVDGGKTGCFNNQCSCYVVADKATYHPGQALAPPLSGCNGQDYFAILSIKKDEKTKDWSLYSASQGKTTLLGWWPGSLLVEASIVQFNGAVIYKSANESPLMGSGHLAEEGERKAAYFKQIKIFDKNGKGYVPSRYDMEISPQDRCYTVSFLKETQNDGLMFYYGGPGCHV